jgi:hypothetical protein
VVFELSRLFWPLGEQTADDARQQDKTLSRYLKPDLLIIDDMGMKQLPRRSGECLLEIIMRRHENRSTMMTSNRPLEDWAKLIGDVPAATAILDRFLQHAQVITITGRSYRLKDHSRDHSRPEQQKVVEPKERKQQGRPAAGGEGLSPPEDTVAELPLSSEGEGSGVRSSD